jgi:uncharacterized RmlC-like cupin family protein
MSDIEVVTDSALILGNSTRGIVRKSAFVHAGIAVGQSTIGGGVESDWHHHGTRALYGFLVSGRLRFDFGPSGRQSLTLGPGDFFHIPVGLVHRDVNPEGERPAVVASVLVGDGPNVVNVGGPED